jgi:hypothetical protein
MLRAYSNDPDFFGDEDYQAGQRNPRPDCVAEAREVRHLLRSSKKVQQYVMDCDSDIALKRIRATVVARHSYGHGSEEWIVRHVLRQAGRRMGRMGMWSRDGLRYETVVRERIRDDSKHEHMR